MLPLGVPLEDGDRKIPVEPVDVVFIVVGGINEFTTGIVVVGGMKVFTTGMVIVGMVAVGGTKLVI